MRSFSRARALVVVVLVSTGAVALLPDSGGACTLALVWRADLGGAGPAPQGKTAATGSAVFHFDLERPEATIDVDLQNVHEVTAIDLRAESGDGPILFTLYSPADGNLPRYLNRRITQHDLQPRPELEISSFTDMVRAVKDGRVFITVSTEAHPGGALRGAFSMRKMPAYSASATDPAHDPHLHEQARRAKDQPGRAR